MRQLTDTDLDTQVVVLPPSAEALGSRARQGGFARRSARVLPRFVGASLALIALSLAGCATEEAGDRGQFQIAASGLAACGGSATAPLSQVKKVELVVREANAAGTMVELDRQAVGVASDGTVKFGDVPAGSPREVTLLGYTAGAATPSWYARRTGINIRKNATTALDVTLMALEDFTCFGAQGGQPNVMLPAATVMEDGKVLITGGFGAAVAENGSIKFDTPSDRAWIFDPHKGTFAAVTAPMKAARAGHSAIYLTKLNQVLIVGGVKQMTMPEAGSAPPTWKIADGVALTWEIYDVASGQFIAPADGGLNARRRVMPMLLQLAGDNVAVLGGAPWPNTDEQGYASGDLFLASRGPGETTGHFKDVAGQLGMQSNRGGSAFAYIGPTAVGTSRYLIWGGNVGSSLFGAGAVAERFEESTETGIGEFYGSFSIEGDYQPTISDGLFFPTLTPIGRGRDNKGKYTDDGRFLLMGGARWRPSGAGAGQWLAPTPDDAYLVSLREPTDAQPQGRLLTTRVASLAQGVFMHQTNLAGSGLAVLTGGFSGFNTPASYKMQVYDVTAGKLLSEGNFPGVAKFVPRGGHAALTLANDCILFYGGAGQLGPTGLSVGAPATSDIYCPNRLAP